MHLRRLTIENVRGFGSGHRALEIELGGETAPRWIVLAGRNGSGKTTVLRAIARAVLGPDLMGLTEDLSPETPWLRRNEKSAHIAVDLEPHGDDEKELSDGRWIHAGLSWKAVHGALSLGVDAQTNADVLYQGPWSGSRSPDLCFAAAYGAHRRLTGHSDRGLDRVLGADRVARMATLFDEGAALVESVRWLQQLNYERLDAGANGHRKGLKRLEALEADTLALLSDGLLPDTLAAVRVDPRGLWLGRHGEDELLITMLSDGYRSVAAMVLDIVAYLARAFGDLAVERHDGHIVVPHHGVVLIDEPEAHLHVSWQQKVGPWLKNHFPNLQFIVATHSPFICQAADLGGLFRLSPDATGPAAEAASDGLYRRVVNGGADDSVLSELFGLDHAHSDHAELLRDEAAALQARVLDRKATARDRTRLRELREQLPGDPGNDADFVRRAVDAKS